METGLSHRQQVLLQGICFESSQSPGKDTPQMVALRMIQLVWVHPALRQSCTMNLGSCWTKHPGCLPFTPLLHSISHCLGRSSPRLVSCPPFASSPLPPEPDLDVAEAGINASITCPMLLIHVPTGAPCLGSVAGLALLAQPPKSPP